MKLSGIIALFLMWTTATFAADAARVGGNLLVDGISFSSGGLPMTTPPLDGKSVRSGTENPIAQVGVEGDFYINTTTNTLFGSKIGSEWGSGVSLVGPKGDKGEQGLPGGPRLSVVDGNNKTIGTYLYGSEYISYLSNGNIYTVSSWDGQWYFPITKYKFYSEINCTGITYTYSMGPQIFFTLEDVMGLQGQPLYKSSPVLPAFVQYKSTYSSDSLSLACSNSAGTAYISPAVQVGVIPPHPVGPITIQ